MANIIFLLIIVLSSTVNVFLQFFVVAVWFLRQVRFKTKIHCWNCLLRLLAGLCTILYEIKKFFFLVVNYSRIMAYKIVSAISFYVIF